MKVVFKFLFLFIFFSVSAQTNVRTFKGHTGFIYSVAFSPDGKYIASGGWDKITIIWDVVTGRPIKRLAGHTGWVNCVQFSPDGKYIATGSTDNNIVLWDAATYDSLGVFNYGDYDVFSLSFSPNSKWLATGTGSAVNIWDIKTYKIVKSLKGHSGWVNSVYYSPDGKFIASGGWDRSAKLWNVATLSLAKSFDNFSANVNALCISNNGKIMVTGSGSGNNAVKIWDIENYKLLKTVKEFSSMVSAVDISSDSKYFAAGSGENINIWDINTATLIKTLSDHAALVTTLKFSSDNRYIVSGSIDKTIKLWKLPNLDSLMLTMQAVDSAKITTVPKAPEYYVTIDNLKFCDRNNNDVLDAGERDSISFLAKNNGSIKTINLTAKIVYNGKITGVVFKPLKLTPIEKGESKVFVIPFEGLSNLTSGQDVFKLEIGDSLKPVSKTVDFVINTQEFKSPKVEVTDYFLQTTDNGAIRAGVPITLNSVIINSGKGDAHKICIRYKLPEKVVLLGKDTNYIEQLKAGESKEVVFGFKIEKKYPDKTVPVMLDLSESLGKYAIDTMVYVEIPPEPEVKQKKSEMGEHPQLYIGNISVASSTGDTVKVNSIAKIKFAIENKGSAPANAIKASIKFPEGIRGIDNTAFIIETLDTAEAKELAAEFIVTPDFKESNAKLGVSVTEDLGKYGMEKFADILVKNNFPAKVQQNQAIEKSGGVEISDFKFKSEDHDSIKVSTFITLIFQLNNKNVEDLANLNIEFVLPNKVEATGKPSIVIDRLASASSAMVEFEFIANREYDESKIPIKISIKNSEGKIIAESSANAVLVNESDDKN